MDDNKMRNSLRILKELSSQFGEKTKSVILIGTYYDDRDIVEQSIENKDFRKNICPIWREDEKL